MKLSDIEFVILAAGKSSRNYPHSKGMPHKSLLPFGSKKIIDYVLSEIIQAGGKHITVIASDKAAVTAFKENFVREQGVEEKFEASGNQVGLSLLRSVYLPEDVEVNFIIQKEQRGLGEAISLASKTSSEKHLAIILPDDLVLSPDGSSKIKQLVDRYVRDDCGGNLFLTREVDDVSRWGIIEDGYFKEKPETSHSNEASIMCFILDKKVVQHMSAAIEADLKACGKGEELHYSDYLNEMIEKDPDVMQIRTLKMHDADLYLDCGSIAGYEKALLYSLLKLSTFKDENVAYLKELLRDV